VASGQAEWFQRIKGPQTVKLLRRTIQCVYTRRLYCSWRHQWGVKRLDT
jgi:hypothetical protein